MIDFMAGMMKRNILRMAAAACVFSMGCLFCDSVRAAEPTAKSWVQGDKTRTYMQYVPAGLNRKTPASLVLVLHGWGGNGEDMVRVTGGQFGRLADAEKFVVVYPDAYGKRWDDVADGVDDKAFILAIVEAVKAEVSIDSSRVYITGLSNGGMMAQGMACLYPGIFASAATVAGTLPTFQVDLCPAPKPMSMLVIHGTADPIIPFDGGPISIHADGVNVISARETTAIWAKAARCQAPVRIVAEPNRDGDDGTTVRREIFGDCEGKREVDLVIVDGGGHTWPGGYQYMPERFIGKTSRDIDAGQTIWNFFKRFSRQ